MPLVDDHQVKRRQGAAHRTRVVVFENLLASEVEYRIGQPGKFPPKPLPLLLPVFLVGTQSHAEGRHPEEEIPTRVYADFVNKAAEVAARHHRSGRSTTNGLHAELSEPHIVSTEIAKFLHPFRLDILSRRDYQNPELRVEVPEQGHGAKGHIGLAHAHLVGQVRDVLLLPDIMDRHGSLKLLV